MARARTQVRHTVSFSTSLHPAAAGALSALAAREPDGSASGVIARLVRAELDRLVPGAWDAAMREADDKRCGAEQTAAVIRAQREGRERTPEDRAAAALRAILDAMRR